MDKLSFGPDILFSSDTHFDHKKLVSFRGFDSCDQMTEALIRNWNKVVKPTSTIIHLGDVIFSSRFDILDRLNGNIYLVPGNHDSKKVLKKLEKRVTIVSDILYVKVQDVEFASTGEFTGIICSHYPMLTWERAHYGFWHLHGHSHGSCNYPHPNARIYDVGVDCNSLSPISYNALKLVMQDRTFAKVDHHE